MPMSRLIVVFLLWIFGTAVHAAPPLSTTALATIDRATLAATQQGDILGLEPYLAPNFQAAIKVPTEQGRFQTLLFNREEFLLYAWHALSVMQDYQVRAQKADYQIAQDGRSAVGTAILDESLHWEGQALRYTTRRTTHYRPNQNQIQITLLEVQVLKWDQPH
ncbi:MAG: hypothetical protein HY941_03940 [Gammaproteobacteria bacterium]|nr:hypothetical protein [Gammaproteobacteria bacterium]